MSEGALQATLPAAALELLFDGVGKIHTLNIPRG
jgi:hypothetical protein